MQTPSTQPDPHFSAPDFRLPGTDGATHTRDALFGFNRERRLRYRGRLDPYGLQHAHGARLVRIDPREAAVATARGTWH